MSNIQVLDPHVADLIAAGEVVERPASVAKELMENAVDAGASKVTVEIRHGGMTFLRVTDDGQGIPAGQVKTAFLRHATSKLRTEYDLEAIGTLGFRGEALAAIAAVSRVEVMTRTPDTTLGCALRLEGGVPGELEEAGCPLGTTMVVRDLFYNTPARLKFMKKDSSEGAAVFAAVQRLALSRPDISVKFLRDGKQELLTPGDGKLKSAVYAVLGRDLALGLREVKGSGEGDMMVTGFVSLPACCRNSRSGQFFFVNGRQVKSPLMTAAVEEAYRNQRMVGKFPACILHLTTKLNAVDVNVHPAKTEVKFGNERQVFSAVFHAVLSTLDGDKTHPTFQLPLQARERAAILEGKAGLESPATPETTRVTLRSQDPLPSVEPPKTAFMPKSVAEREQRATSVSPVDVEASKCGSAVVPTHSTGSYYRGNRGVDVFWEPPDGKQEEKKYRPNVQKLVVTPSSTPVSLDKDQGCARTLEPAKRLEGNQQELDAGIQSDAATVPSERLVEEGSTSVSKMKDPSLLPPQPQDWRMAGEVLNTYIVVEQGDRIYFIDKHAAHERMNFDRMKAQGYDPMAQTLLAPVVFRLGVEEQEELLRHQDLLEEFGFEVDELGGSLAVRQAPFDVAVEDIPATLTEIAQKLLATGEADPTAARDELLHTMACKAAIKGGWKSSPQELERVVRAVMEGAVKYCPHGRPVAIELTKKDLEKQFKRA
ncbi:MAG: DNA mismatch repair endonuclease MutL [Lawsonibacter sp.]|jgi:DNA mismatch repair protein MutL